MRSLTDDPRRLRAVWLSLVHLRARLGTGCAVLAAVAGCGSDTVATRPLADVGTLYWALALDHHAVTLSTTKPHDTIRLTATPVNARGDALEGLGEPKFSSGDLTRVRVSPDGVVQALAEGRGVPVVASLQAGGASHYDTAFITITADAAPYPLARLSIQPVPPDSAKLALAVLKSFTAVAFDSAGMPIPDVAVYFQSLDPSIAGFGCNPPEPCGKWGVALVNGKSTPFRGARPGSVTIVASATVYGVARADTLPFTIGLPISRTILVQPASQAGTTTASGFVPSEIRVGTGAAMTWSWKLGAPPTDVVFDDSTAVAELTSGSVLAGVNTGAGNIVAPDTTVCNSTGTATLLLRAKTCQRGRSFPVPGVYDYHSTLTGATGRIIVVDEHVTSNP